MNNLLIWDIDGTLIQGRGIGRRAMEKVFLSLYGIENGLSGIEMAGMLDSIIIENAFVLHNLKNKDRSEFFDTYCELLQEETDNLQYEIKAPGILELLEALQNKDGYYHVLGTGNIERGARIKLSKDNLNRFFPTGGFGDEPMERWQVIEKAIHNSQDFFGMEFKPQNIYVIGDTPKDMACGLKLGIKTIGTATGPYSTEQLLECGAQVAFADLTDIKEFTNVFSNRLTY